MSELSSPPRRSMLRLGLVVLGLLSVTLVLGRIFAFEIYRERGTHMIPTLLRDDRFVTNELAYGLHVPFTKTTLFQSTPKRGDLIVFERPETSRDHARAITVSRVIGLPGDVVDVFDRHVVVNEVAFATKSRGLVDLDIAGDAGGTDPNSPVTSYALFEETIGGLTHLNMFKPTSPQVRPFQGRWRVDADHLFVLNDNRDEAPDSRFDEGLGGYGQVPIKNVKGRVSFVVSARPGGATRPSGWLKPVD